MTNSTSKAQISMDLPNWASATIRYILKGLGVNAVDEVFPAQEILSFTLDANGEDDGAAYLTTPDATGTSSYAYTVQAQASGGTTWTTLGDISFAWSASAQELGALLEADDSAVGATKTGITTAEATWVAAGLAANPTAADWVDVAGDTMSGTLAMADNAITRPVFTDYGETVNAIGSIGGGTQDIDLTLGNVVSGTVDTSTTTFTFSNPSASGVECSFTLYLTNGGSQTVNWPASVDWAGGTAPTLTAAGVDILTFTTIDGGTIWYGFAAGLDMQ